MKNLLENRPPTAVFSTRADLRTIAALAEYFISKGFQPSSVSELLRLGIEVFVDLLESNKNANRPRLTSEALQYLNRIGLSKTLSSRNRSTLIKQLELEDLELENIDPSYRKSKTKISQDQFEKAREILRHKTSFGGEILGKGFGQTKKEGGEEDD